MIVDKFCTLTNKRGCNSNKTLYTGHTPQEIAVMAKKSITLESLAFMIEKQNKQNYDKWQALRDLAIQLDESFFKSSKIEKRGEFVAMCGMEP
jgi:hypothetical protein